MREPVEQHIGINIHTYTSKPARGIYRKDQVHQLSSQQHGKVDDERLSGRRRDSGGTEGCYVPHEYEYPWAMTSRGRWRNDTSTKVLYT